MKFSKDNVHVLWLVFSHLLSPTQRYPKGSTQELSILRRKKQTDPPLHLLVFMRSRRFQSLTEPV